MLRPGDPREGNKKPLDKKLRDPKKNDKKQDLTKRMGGLITSRPIMFIGIQWYDIATIWSPSQGSDLWLHGQRKGGLITSQPYHFCEDTSG
jgi:hypothetical protein